MLDITDKRRRQALDDPRSTDELIDLALKERDPYRHYQLVCLLQQRGTPEVYEAAKKLLASTFPSLRKTGVDILSQSTLQEKTFPDDTATHIVALLDDKEYDAGVLSSICQALCHTNDDAIIARLAELAEHYNPGVRQALARTFGAFEHDIALQTLLRLMEDRDEETRFWATFGVGSLNEKANSPDIREALFTRLEDRSVHTRAEALYGLTIRGDERAIDALMKELSGTEVSVLAIEAAIEIRDPRIYPSLVELKFCCENTDRWMQTKLERALIACRPV